MNVSARRRRRVRAAAAVVVAALVVTASVLGVGTKRGTAATGGGTLNVPCAFGTQFSGPNFNPYGIAGHASVQFMFLPLEVFNTYTGDLVPMLATGHKLLGAKGVQFTLRKGVKWSDGKPLTAADVAFSIKLLQKNPSLDANGVGLTIASVKVKGNTITFKYKKPNAVLYKQLADVYIVPRHKWASVKDATTFTNYPNPVVSGPYKLVSYDTTRDVLKPNPKYFNKNKIKVSEINCRPTQPGPTQIPELQAGKWDWDMAGDFTPGGFKTDFVDKNPKINHFWIVPVGTVTIFLNNAKPPFNDTALRRALSYALDRATIGKTSVPAGYAKAASQTGLMDIPTDRALIPKSVPNKGVVKQNFAKAKQILIAAGYTYEGSDLIGKDGKRVSFTLSVPNGFTDWIVGAEIVRKQWSALGVDVTIATPQPPAHIGALVTGNYEAAEWAIGINSGGGYYLLKGALDSTLTADIGSPAGADWGRVKMPAVDVLLRKIEASTGIATQKKATGKLAEYVYERVPWIALTSFPGWYQFRTNKYVGWPDAKHPYTYGGVILAGQGVKATTVLLVIERLRPAK